MTALWIVGCFLIVPATIVATCRVMDWCSRHVTVRVTR